jgi:hypothetical protein
MRAAITRSLWTKTHHAYTDNATTSAHWQPYGEANTMANNPNDRGMQNPSQAQQGQGKQSLFAGNRTTSRRPRTWAA